MMSKSRFAVSTSAFLLLGLMAGCATTPRDALSSLAGDKVASAKQEKPGAGCVNDTGSRIQRKDDDKDACRNAGRTYTQEELERTGDFNAAAALRRLDPSIQ